MFEEYTRWNRDHTESISIRYQDSFTEDVVRDSAECYGVKVYTTVWGIANVFSEEGEVCSKHMISKAREEAIARGDYVFYLWYGEHGNCAFGISEKPVASSWDSGCCGILVVDKYKVEFPPRSTNEIYKAICAIFVERVEAVLNGWIYEAIVDSEDGGCTFCDYLTPEDALAAAQNEYPHIKYEESDFEVNYSLVSTVKEQ